MATECCAAGGGQARFESKQTERLASASAALVAAIICRIKLALARLPLGVESHQGRYGNPVHNDGNGNGGQGNTDCLFGHVAGQTMIKGEHQVIDGANATNAKPGNQKALIARYRSAEQSEPDRDGAQYKKQE